MSKLKFCLLWVTLYPLYVGAQYKSAVWSPDNGDGTYTNPVLYADYSDPDVCAVGEDYYLTASSFNCVPGLPILHSKDLVNWEIVGHALQELEPKSLFDNPQHGKGVWAPSIRHHNDSLYIYWGDPDQGIFMVKRRLPKTLSQIGGEWSEPICVIAGKGMIDPCPLWDEDGRCFLVNAWANSRAGFNSVLSVRELSADGSRAISQPRIAFDGGQENHTAEGPKFYKRDGWYWLMCPAGGVEMGWQLAMRSRSPFGPYEWRRVMWQGNTDINGPHQGAWVHTAFGEDWFLHFNDKGAYGRVVCLQPVDWSGGWPMMGKNGEPYTRYLKPKSSSKIMVNPQENDEFSDGLGLQWQWHANYHQFYGQPSAAGIYRLYTMDLPSDFRSLWDIPNLLLQKPTAPRFTATAKVRFAAKEDGQYAGLVMMGRDYSALIIRRDGDGFLLQCHTCINADEGQAEKRQTVAALQPSDLDSIPYSPAIYLDLFLRLTVKDGIVNFYYSLDGNHFKSAGKLEQSDAGLGSAGPELAQSQFKSGGEPFRMRQGKWIGAKLGFVAACIDRKDSRGWLDIDWIRITSTNE
ncbi:MAG: glycoside hydrolase 43 family protein [Bacteroidaceae bacterium]|nr:glycoside hydrolase 43 family protein [Bacteroidaceae bacterium]